MEYLARLLVLLVSVGMAGCDRDTPTSPTRPVVPASPFVGAWVGTIVDSAAGSGVLRLTITEHVAISLVGSWAAMFGNEALNDSGSLTASLDGSNLRLFLTGQSCSPSAGVRTTIANLVVEGTRMAGSYISLGCGAPRDGRVDLTRQ